MSRHRTGTLAATRRSNSITARLLAALLLFSTAAFAATPEVRVQGGTSEQQDNIITHLMRADMSCERDPWQERLLLRDARRKTEQALQALGHYHARIEVAIVPDDDCWILEIRINPGDPVRLRNIRVSVEGPAGQDPAFRDLLDSSPLRQGDALRHDLYDSFRIRLTRLAEERGYFSSKLQERRIDIDLTEQAADISLHLQSGPRYRYGRITFSQHLLTNHAMARFVTFAEGEPFDNNDLLDLRQSLAQSGYFREIHIDTVPDAPAPGQVQIEIDTTPRARYGFLMGAGFATDTGPRIRLGLENRYVNRHGHRSDAEVEVSDLRQGVGINYEIPRNDPARQRINLGTSYQRERTSTSLSERYRSGIAYLWQMDNGWLATTDLEYEREYFTIAGQRDRTDLLLPGYELSRTTSNDPVLPVRGWRLSGKIRAAHESLISTISMVQVHVTAKGILPLAGGRILARTELGMTSADELTQLPTSVRFFAGGDNSVRGFGYRSLGTKNEDGKVVGGRHIMVGSLEYDHVIVGRWHAAIFADSGNAYDTLNTFEPRTGLGVGIRWISPIGPIRFDMAAPVDSRRDFRLHISMGPDL